LDIWLYILRCADGSYYTGTARGGLEARVGQHNVGYFDGYTPRGGQWNWCSLSSSKR